MQILPEILPLMQIHPICWEAHLPFKLTAAPMGSAAAVQQLSEWPRLPPSAIAMTQRATPGTWLPAQLLPLQHLHLLVLLPRLLLLLLLHHRWSNSAEAHPAQRSFTNSSHYSSL